MGMVTTTYPPENRPSVREATSFPNPAPIIKLVGLSISGIPIRIHQNINFIQNQHHQMHTRSTLRSQIPQHNNSLLSLFNLASFDGVYEFLFAVEYACFSCEGETFFTRYFGYCAAWGEVAAEDSVGWGEVGKRGEGGRERERERRTGCVLLI
jgi:hypothetical protein